MNVRKYEKKDIPALMRIWNEVVEAGQAYPQEELLTEQTAEEFFAAQSFTAAAEDNGEVVGECFAKALGSKKGIERYGFALPMDDAKAEVLLDFGGRTWLEWGVTLKREYVGDFPTEMARHFFASFCQSGLCNLHISAQGENTHHILEAVFKAFARAVRQAIRQTGGGIPSSKGCLA